jgi:hypothetical protein
MTARVVLPILVVLPACGQPAGCDEIEAAAGQTVREVLDSPQPCGIDDDCVVVAVSGSCFDNCSAVIARSNLGDFDEAVAAAEADHCSDYDGCTLIVPPCAPPEPATCSADGACRGG